MNALRQDGETDYTLQSEASPNVWVSVNNISVCIIRTDEGVVIDCYAKGKEMNEPLASTYAFFTEAQEEIDEEE